MKQNYKKPTIIAEIGCNHKGNLKIAKDLIFAAAKAGANVAKFQKRDNRLLLKDNYFEKHPVPHNSYGNTYGEHREFLEFSIDQHYELYRFCIKNNIQYSTSVWEINSAKQITESKINLSFLKIPSACNLDFKMLDYLCRKFKKKIHISLGMTNNKEIRRIYDFINKRNRLKDIIFYACTSDYPVKFDDVCLLEISNLKKKYNNKIYDIGFSGHHLGIGIDVSAYTLGANFIERHFTLDRTWKGTDHAASLEQDGLTKLVRNINATFRALKFKGPNVLKTEIATRKKLKNIIDF